MRLLIAFMALCFAFMPLSAQDEAGKLNKRFLDPNMEVDQFINMFERETREVAGKRADIVKALNLKPGMVVADIGAGTGLFMPDISKAVGNTGHYIGVEISMGFVSHLRTRAVEENLDNVMVVLSTLDSATLAPASVDMIFVCDTYHHFDQPAAMLASKKAALKPGGKLVIIDFHRIPGVSDQWHLDHVRAGRDEVMKEVTDAGFKLDKEIKVGLEENYMLRFTRP